GDDVAELVEPAGGERVEVHREPLLPGLARASLDVGGHVAAGTSHERAAQPVAGEPVDAQEGHGAVLDQPGESLELVRPLVESDRGGAKGEEGGGGVGGRDDPGEDEHGGAAPGGPRT